MVPEVNIIAGPNGAGKSTFYEKRKNDYAYINLDDIAKEINPELPGQAAVQAGRIAISELNKFINNKQSFIIETTLSGQFHLNLIKKLRTLGWKIGLTYICVNEISTSLRRVKERYRLGGHNVPDEDIIRRYHRSLANFKNIIRLPDLVEIYDNSYMGHNFIMALFKGRILFQDKNLPLWLQNVLSPNSLTTRILEEV